MVTQHEAHESVQVLLFICLPLLLLLIAFIVVSVRASRTIAKFPTFFVQIWLIRGRPSLLQYRSYREAKRLVEFQVVPSSTRAKQEGRRKFVMRFLLTWLKNARGEIVLIAPKELTDEDIQSIADNISLGLAKLGFDEYKICRECENQILAAGKTKELLKPN